jgi:uncharacterized membrane protein
VQTAFVLLIIGTVILAVGIVLAVLGVVLDRANAGAAGERSEQRSATPAGGIVRHAFPVLVDSHRPAGTRSLAGGLILSGLGVAVLVLAGLVAVYEALPSMLC